MTTDFSSGVSVAEEEEMSSLSQNRRRIASVLSCDAVSDRESGVYHLTMANPKIVL